MEEKEKTFKVRHHIATSPFSFFEVESEGSMKTIVSQARWLALQFQNNNQK
jgi:hypothetical protein